MAVLPPIFADISRYDGGSSPKVMWGTKAANISGCRDCTKRGLELGSDLGKHFMSLGLSAQPFGIPRILRLVLVAFLSLHVIEGDMRDQAASLLCIAVAGVVTHSLLQATQQEGTQFSA